MKRTLVLAVDRDDDFGVKGKVSTPVIGIQDCITAANSLGIIILFFFKIVNIFL